MIQLDSDIGFIRKRSDQLELVLERGEPIETLRIIYSVMTNGTVVGEQEISFTVCGFEEIDII